MKKYLDEDGLLLVVENIKIKEDKLTEKLKDYTDESIQSEKLFNEEYYDDGTLRIKSLLMKSGYKDNVLAEDAKYQGGILAAGYNNKVDGFGSITGGTGNTNTGSRSIVVSRNSTNSGACTAVFGQLNSSYSESSIIGGYGNKVDLSLCGWGSTLNIVSGNSNYVEGDKNTVNALWSFCSGRGNIQYGGNAYSIIVNGPDENGYYTIRLKENETTYYKSLNNQLSYYDNLVPTAIIEWADNNTPIYYLVLQYMVDGNILFKFAKFNYDTGYYEEMEGGNYDNVEFWVGANLIMDGRYSLNNGSISVGNSCLVNGGLNFAYGNFDPIVGGWYNTCYGSLNIGYGNKTLPEGGSVIGRGNVQVAVNNPRIVDGQCLLDIYSGEYYAAYQEIYKNLGNLSTINDIFKYSVICIGNGSPLFGTTILGVKEITDTAITCIVSHITLFDPSKNYTVRINGALVSRWYSLAIGQGNTSWGYQSFSGGAYCNSIGNHSLSFGINSLSIGNDSQAFGNHTVTQNANETALGTYNVSTKNETVFSIGNGTSTERHNLLELKKDGNLYLNDININEKLNKSVNIVSLTLNEYLELYDNDLIDPNVLYAIINLNYDYIGDT